MMYKKLFIIALTMILTACSSTSDMTASQQGATELSHETLGVRYLLGRGVRQSDDKAFFHFKKAAEAGNANAENELAYLYFAGRGTMQDNEAAFYWYQKAAAAGVSSAQYNLAILYERGIGTRVDKALASQWYQKAADNGFSPAKLALAHSEKQ